MTAYVNRAVMEECPRTFRAAHKQHQSCSRAACSLSLSLPSPLRPLSLSLPFVLSFLSRSLPSVSRWCIIFKRSESPPPPPRARNLAEGKEKRSVHEPAQRSAARRSKPAAKLTSWNAPRRGSPFSLRYHE